VKFPPKVDDNEDNHINVEKVQLKIDELIKLRGGARSKISKTVDDDDDDDDDDDEEDEVENDIDDDDDDFDDDGKTI
jgi:hypothetical protein